MKTVEIKHRITAAVLFSCDVEDADQRPVRTALMAASRAGRDPKLLKDERNELRAQMADHDEWDEQSDEERETKTRLLTILDHEIESPRPDAYLAGAYLAGANLAHANLADAYLAGAYLAGANLAHANLADANLADADLAGADLAGADLAGADLAGADLAHAYLAGAYLAGADLAGADLADANLADADLAGADLAHARNLSPLVERKDPPEPYVRPVTSADRAKRLAEHAARFRERNPNVPVVDRLDARILEEITKPGHELNMGSWHGGESYTDGTACGTTHCRAGWAVMVAGPAGLALERELGSAEAAARAIYRASTGRVPHFFASQERALEDLKRCAAEQTTEVQS